MSESNLTAAAQVSRTEAIRQRIAKGGTLAAIAAEFGVTRQYVSVLKIQLANGKDGGTSPGRGRRPQQPFNAAERAAFAAALQGPPPLGKPAWTRLQARRWFLRNFGRMPPAEQLEQLANELGVKFSATAREKYDASFYRWQASPAAARIREMEASGLDTLDADLEADLGKTAAGKTISGEAAADDSALDEVAAGKLTEAGLRFIEQANAETARQMWAPTAPLRAPGAKIGRNEPCPRNPALKFKRCCGANGGHYCTRAAEAQ